MTKQEIIDYMYKNHVQGDFKIEEMAEDFAQPDLQPTCNQLATDTISRQDAIEAVEDTDWYHQNKKGEMVHGANPSDHQAWYKAEDIYKVLESLPSAEPEPKTGEWINKFFYGIGEGSAECSICHKRTSGYKEDTGWSVHCLFYDFCPKCGSDNREEKRNE